MIRLIRILAIAVAVGSALPYDDKQVAKAETNTDECRKKHADNRALAEVLRQRHCALFDELAKEKRKAYEDRKRRERERVAEDARG